MAEVSSAYRGCRERITDLLSRVNEQQATASVPTCPDWTVHDVVAHLSGSVADFLAGRVDGAGTDKWTAAQIEARRANTVEEILHEWNTNAPKVEPAMDAASVGPQAVTDAVTHEHDIRCALGQPGARDSEAVIIGLNFAAPHVVDTACSHGLLLRVQTANGWAHGPDDAEVTLTGAAFDLLRAMTGRRSVDQLLEMQWEGDGRRAIPAFSFLGLQPAATRIIE